MFHFLTLAFIRVSEDLQSLSVQALIQISKNIKFHVWLELYISVAALSSFPVTAAALQCLQHIAPHV